MRSDITGFSERFKNAQIGLKEILTVIDSTETGEKEISLETINSVGLIPGIILKTRGQRT